MLEYNPIQQSASTNSNRPSTFVIRSTQAQISKAPAAVWHKRLAYCGPKVLKHLPTSVTDVKLVNGPSTTECETCAVSKAHKIVSWRPLSKAKKPFDRVY